MIRFVRGSLFDSDAQTLVNPVNCIGVSGKGLAKEFKKRFPSAQSDYERACRGGCLEIGDVWLWKAPLAGKQWVLHFPTKQHWRDPSKLEFIERGLSEFVRRYDALGITSVAFPALGCGNGGLDWADVKPLMERHLEPIDVPVAIYLPIGETSK